MLLSRKKIRILLCALQALLIGLIFVPAGISRAEDTVIETCRLYGGAGYGVDSYAYLFLALAIPVGTVFSLFLLKERRNYGLTACLAALLTVVHAVFFSAVKLCGAVPLTTAVRVRFYFLVFLGLFSMGVGIYAYLLAGKQDRGT